MPDLLAPSTLSYKSTVGVAIWRVGWTARGCGLLRQADPPADLEAPRNWILPSRDHAVAIVEFFKMVQPRVKKVVIHCEAGISRSAGVGAALAHCLGQPDEQFFCRSHPNHRVRHLVIEAWRRS